MTHHDLVKHYGTGTKAAKALGVDQRTISVWRVRGIPVPRQYQIQIATRGALKVPKHDAA